MIVLSTEKRVNDLQAALLAVDRSRVRAIFQEGVQADGALPFMEGIVGIVLDRIGDAWQTGRLALSHVYMAGRICEELSLSILPEGHSDRKDDPSIALAVFEDHHILGKQLVHAVLRNDGFRVQDLGRVNLQQVLERVRTGTVDVLLLSCLMLSSALRMGRLCEAIKTENLRVKVIVGGAPFRFDPQLWREVGADSMGYTASQSPSLVRSVSQDRV